MGKCKGIINDKCQMIKGALEPARGRFGACWKWTMENDNGERGPEKKRREKRMDNPC
jgi:hypothetical protein